MIFRQKVSKEEKLKFAIQNLGVLIPYAAIAILCLMQKTESRLFVTFILVFGLPIFLTILILGLVNLEWYDVYKDRIEARCVFGVKNVVLLKDVIFIEETVIYLTTRGMKKEFYIFNDGRKNNNNRFGENSCYNKRKYNLRVYKTNKLERFITNNTKIVINKL